MLVALDDSFQFSQCLTLGPPEFLDRFRLKVVLRPIAARYEWSEIDMRPASAPLHR